MSVRPVDLAELTSLLEELADAALDSVEVVLGHPDDDDRATHAHYLQDLHRFAQGALARTCG